MSKNLADLVPSPELCKQIPEGAFSDSALVWILKSAEAAEVWERAQADNIPPIWSKILAPTLEEIEEALYEQTDFVGTKLFDGVFQISAFREDDLDTSVPVAVSCRSAALAALKLWFKQRGIKYED